MTRYLYSAVIFLALALPARAWNGVGHQAVAELAWRQLNGQQRRAASELLRQHPHYQVMLLAEAPAAGVDTNQWVFLKASVWLDNIRPAKPGQPPKPKSITSYDIYPHAIGYPLLGPGETNRALLEKFFIARPDAEMVLSNALVTLHNPKAAVEQRAVSLCVVLHLIGDLHQPLHASNIVTSQNPGGSGLGGACLVLGLDGQQNNLHTFWDQLPGLDFSYSAIAALADKLAAAPELKAKALAEYARDRSIASWVQESFQAAVSLAYAPGRVQYADAALVKSGQMAHSAIPVLKPDYIRDAHQVAQRRLALAGQRLADELKRVW